MKKRQLLVILFFCIFISCNKILDTVPSSDVTVQNYYSSQGELNLALSGVYNKFLQLPGMGYLYVDFNVTDECCRRINSTGIEAFNTTYSDAKISALWRTLYSGISDANSLIVNINKANGIAAVDKNAILGEATFLRGYFYYILVTYFGAVPLIIEPVIDPTSANFPRTPISDIYSQIIKDMQKAEELVKTKTQWGGEALAATHVTKTTVQGILARVFLSMAGYPLNGGAEQYKNARDYALKVMNSGEHSLINSITTLECPSAYAQVFVNAILDKYNPNESMWEIDYSGYSGTIHAGSWLGSSVGLNYTANNTNIVGRGFTGMGVNGSLFALYENAGVGKTDFRRDWAIGAYDYRGSNVAALQAPTTNQFINSRYPGKWRRSYSVGLATLTTAAVAIPNPTIYNSLNTLNASYTSINFPLLRYSDILLMYAEADFQVNKSLNVDALNAINQVRRRAYGLDINSPGYADLSNAQKIDFMNTIIDERARELCFEALRRNDLIRWGIYVNTLKAVVNSPNMYFRDYAGNTLSKYTTSVATANIIAYSNFQASPEKFLLYPIPAAEMNSNKSITVQNPGW